MHVTMVTLNDVMHKGVKGSFRLGWHSGIPLVTWRWVDEAFHQQMSFGCYGWLLGGFVYFASVEQFRNMTLGNQM